MIATKDAFIMLCAILIAGHQAEAIRFLQCNPPDLVGKFLHAEVTGCKDDSATDCAVDEGDEVKISFTFNSGPGYRNASYSLIGVVGNKDAEDLAVGNACDTTGFNCPGEPKTVQKLELEFTAMVLKGNRTFSVWPFVDGDTKATLACVGFVLDIDSPKSLGSLIVGSSNQMH